jgi:hypothetical protein
MISDNFFYYCTDDEDAKFVPNSIATNRKGAKPNRILESEPPVERRPVDVTTRWMTPKDTQIAAPSPTIAAMNGGIPWIPA